MRLVSTSTQTIWSLPSGEIIDYCPTPAIAESYVKHLELRNFDPKQQSTHNEYYDGDSLDDGFAIGNISTSYDDSVSDYCGGDLRQSPQSQFHDEPSKKQETFAESSEQPKQDEMFCSTTGHLGSVVNRPILANLVESVNEITSSMTYTSGYQTSEADTSPIKKSKLKYPDCQVCGDEAAGFHCGAFVCEACKKFFLRYAKNSEKVISCPKSDKKDPCEINKDSRTQCPGCRYKKCTDVGMLPPGQNLIDVTKIESLKCKVCGGTASGFHFGTLSCEGCRGFFRRLSKTQKGELVCPKGGACNVSFGSRSMCRACRYKKCIATGMSPEATRVGRQPNSVRHARLLENQEVSSNFQQLTEGVSPAVNDNTSSAEAEAEANPGSRSEVSSSEEMEVEAAHSSSTNYPYTAEVTYLLHTEDMEQPAYLNDLEHLKSIFVVMQTDIFKLVELNQQLISTLKREDILTTAFANFRHILYSQVNFLKKLPGFLQLDIEDKVTIAKDSIYKSKLLLTSYSYDLKTNLHLYYFFRSDSMACEWIDEVLPEVTSSRKHFAECGVLIKSLNLDLEEYALIAALNSFDPGIISEIKGKGNFLAFHNKYMYLLATYIKGKYNDPMKRFTELVSILNLCAEARKEHAEGARQLVLNHIELQLQTKGDVAYMIRMFQEVYGN